MCPKMFFNSISHFFRYEARLIGAQKFSTSRNDGDDAAADDDDDDDDDDDGDATTATATTTPNTDDIDNNYTDKPLQGDRRLGGGGKLHESSTKHAQSMRKAIRKIHSQIFHKCMHKAFTKAFTKHL